jgi:hypothetical protein
LSQRTLLWLGLHVRLRCNAVYPSLCAEVFLTRERGLLLGAAGFGFADLLLARRNDEQTEHHRG